MCIMTLQTYLDENEIHYRLARHDRAYTAQELAAAEHVPGRTVIKPVVVRADGQWVMCALPASYKVDLGELASQLLAERVELVTESELRSRVNDCECGAEPPIGLLYGMPTLMDESLVRDTHVIFQAGTHVDAVVMTLADYRRVAQPEMAHFGRPVG
jgi:Ala-tRNA(Pro) deacylase